MTTYLQVRPALGTSHTFALLLRATRAERRGSESGHCHNTRPACDQGRLGPRAHGIPLAPLCPCPLSTVPPSPHLILWLIPICSYGPGQGTAATMGQLLQVHVP